MPCGGHTPGSHRLDSARVDRYPINTGSGAWDNGRTRRSLRVRIGSMDDLVGRVICPAEDDIGGLP